MVAAAVARWGRLDVLHNNVGIESREDLLETTEEEWDQVLEVDLKSVFLATRAAVPASWPRGGGSVIYVSSIAGHRGHGRTAYPPRRPASRASSHVAGELGPQGVRVNAIAPGQVWTPMVQGLGPGARERRRKAGPSAGGDGLGRGLGRRLPGERRVALGDRPRPRHRRRPHRHDPLGVKL